jgi:predicted P-loop ATPase
MDNGKIVKTARSRTQKDAARALSDSLDHWLGAKVAIRFNTLAQQTEIFEFGTDSWREFRDSDSVNASFAYERSTGKKVGSFRVHETLRALAEQRPYDPLREHILSLPQWDGQKRLDTWLVDAIRAEDTPYTRLVSRKWLIAAISRALNPGCKVDNVLILHGEQGEGKSTLLRDLAGDEFFNEEDFDFGNTQKAGLALRGTWIHEWAELDSMSRATHTRLKSFISERFSRFRPPYGRETVMEPRRCVFAGSSNKDDFLTDSTGNRRFWPVKIGTYRRDFFQAMRDQLLAEAKEAYLDGERCWLTQEEEFLASRPRELVEHEDAWTEDVMSYLQGRREVSMKEITEHLTIPLERVEIKQQSRIAGILRKAGWRQGPKEKGRRLWRPLEKPTGN